MKVYRKNVLGVSKLERGVSRVNVNLREKGEIDLSDRSYSSRPSATPVNEDKAKQADELVTADKRFNILELY